MQDSPMSLVSTLSQSASFLDTNQPCTGSELFDARCACAAATNYNRSTRTQNAQYFGARCRFTPFFVHLVIVVSPTFNCAYRNYKLD